MIYGDFMTNGEVGDKKLGKIFLNGLEISIDALAGQPKQ